MKLVVFGSSTGGTRILESLFKGLPKLDCAMAIVQHINAPFCQKFAKSLDVNSGMNVICSDEEEIFKPGTAFVARGGKHLEITYPKAQNKDGEPVNYVHPAIDVTLKSIPSSKQIDLTVILLTGMGKDGVEGVKYLKEKRQCHLIAQSEESCSVFGIPKRAIETGLVDSVMSPEDIKNFLIKNYT